MKEFYEEMMCDKCSDPVCYMINCVPRGVIICSGCYEDEDEETSKDRDKRIRSQAELIGGLREEVSELRAMRKKLKKKLKKERTRSNGRQMALSEMQESFQQEIDDHERTSSSLSKCIKGRDDESLAYNDKRVEFIEQINELNSELASIKREPAEMKKLRLRADDAEGKYLASEKRLAEAAKRADAQGEKMTALSTEIEALKSQLESKASIDRMREQTITNICNDLDLQPGRMGRGSALVKEAIDSASAELRRKFGVTP